MHWQPLGYLSIALFSAGNGIACEARRPFIAILQQTATSHFSSAFVGVKIFPTELAG